MSRLHPFQRDMSTLNLTGPIFASTIINILKPARNVKRNHNGLSTTNDGDQHLKNRVIIQLLRPFVLTVFLLLF